MHPGSNCSEETRAEMIDVQSALAPVQLGPIRVTERSFGCERHGVCEEFMLGASRGGGVEVEKVHWSWKRSCGV